MKAMEGSWNMVVLLPKTVSFLKNWRLLYLKSKCLEER